MEKKPTKGHVTLGSAIGMSLTILGMIGGVFVWTFSQFESVNANAATTDSSVSAIAQHVNDMEEQLTNIQDQNYQIIQLINRQHE